MLHGICTLQNSLGLITSPQENMQRCEKALPGVRHSGKYTKLDEESDADLFGVFTADEYKTTFGLEVAMQL